MNLEIKKELVEKEFKKILYECEKKFQDIEDIIEIALGCEEKTKYITPAEEAFVLLTDFNNKKFNIITSNKELSMEINKESLMNESIQTKQALIINDATSSFLYSKKIDNFFEYDVKDLLIVPILDDSDNKNIIAIVWACIKHGNLNQFTQKDVEYMERFYIFIKRFLLKQDMKVLQNKKEEDFVDYKQEYEKLRMKNNREQEYFSTIIHDVRTPMNAVMGFLELLKAKEYDNEKKEYINVALKSGETMVALINDALDLAKIANGSMNIEKIDFSPFEELSDVAKLFYNSARKKGITFLAYYDPKMPVLIYSDFHRIKQIMNNLLSNAIKFTKNNGEVRLKLLYNEKLDGLKISIEDNGIGIEEKMQESIFTPFMQEKTSTSREYGGTGLGLSISQQLSVLLGGKLELESYIGKGSKFYFTIPCNTKKDIQFFCNTCNFEDILILCYSKQKNKNINIFQQYLEDFKIRHNVLQKDEKFNNILNSDFDILTIYKDTFTDKEIQKVLDKKKSVLIIDDGYTGGQYNKIEGKIKRISLPILPHELYKIIAELINFESIKIKEEESFQYITKIKGKHILVVDDNVINLKFMQEVLNTMYLKVDLAINSEECLKKFKDNIYDMVFMDENMPDKRGSETIEIIRKSEENKKVKPTVIVSLTGDTDKVTRKMLLNKGANSVLTKPIHIQNIKNTLLEYL